MVAKELIRALPTLHSAKPFKGRDVIESIMETDMARTKYEARELASVFWRRECVVNQMMWMMMERSPKVVPPSTLWMYVFVEEEKNDDIKEDILFFEKALDTRSIQIELYVM